MDWISDPQAWIALATLTVLEIVLGIDNIIFISILAGKLPKEQQKKARQLGLALALITRILLLFSISWLSKLTAELFSVFGHGVSGRDLILGAGGLFLLGKATVEIHEKIEGGAHKDQDAGKGTVTFGSVLIQVMMLDVVFSIDSVITAIGMADDLGVMVTAVIISVLFMLVFVNAVSDFVDRHPTVKVLALSFLLMIGLTLVGEGMGFHIPKGYVYFAMAFSVFVEMVNLRVKVNTTKAKEAA
ncbi:TerC family protein [Sulfidibacter corallicola]|uniref:TerC family protein n=1 Tax=Sulfidibacter corallicola TaxID=2818388 RepID=UPI001F351E7E|nr:TerC family protein [Sulfidibacter corallicola]